MSELTTTEKLLLNTINRSVEQILESLFALQIGKDATKDKEKKQLTELADNYKQVVTIHKRVHKIYENT